MRKLEYKVMQIHGATPAATLEDLLNLESEEGWRLVTISRRYPHYFLVFEREI